MHDATGIGSLPDNPGILRTINCLYAAASAEVTWDRAVEEICRTGCFDAGTLSSVARIDRRPFVLSAHGQGFASGAPGILPPNPLLTDNVLDSASGAIWRDHEIMSPSLLRTTSFWLDWMRPNQFISWTGMVVGRRDEQVVCLDLYSRAPRPSFASETTRLMTQLAPHLTRAWRMGEVLHQASSTPAGMAVAHHPDGGEVARLRADFGLTRAEARLALALAAGRSLAEAAELFGRKLSTIRSQLQQIFAKTGASRQAELVVLLLGRGFEHSSGLGTVPHRARP